MKRRIAPVVAVGLLALVASCAPDGGPTAVNPASQLSAAANASSNGNAFGNSNELNGPANAHINFARGFENMSRTGFENGAKVGLARTNNVLMTNHGGKIMPYSTVKVIFWGPSWATSSDDKISGLDIFYSSIGGSGFMRSNTEYSGSNGAVGTASTYQGHIVDPTSPSGGGSSSAILAEVCKQVTAGNITVDASGNGYYAVYTDLPRGNAGYCAWHSSGSCGGKPVQFAFFWRLDGDAGCDPGDTSGLHSQGLAALANVSAHELSEAVTDPASPGAWYDGSGNENADKCAWSWGHPLVTFGSGSQWKVQGNWSNNAYKAGTGYSNRSGQPGCLDG